jgi:hypothetical protein
MIIFQKSQNSKSDNHENLSSNEHKNGHMIKLQNTGQGEITLLMTKY